MEEKVFKSGYVTLIGQPNVGKSTLINRIAGRNSAKTADKPGVTRGKQWIALGQDIMLLDTPGILWPKFEDPSVGLDLAFCGSIKDEIMDLETLGLRLIEKLSDIAPDMLQQNLRGHPGSHQQHRLFKKIKACKDFFEDKPKQYDKEKTKQPQQGHIQTRGSGC